MRDFIIKIFKLDTPMYFSWEGTKDSLTRLNHIIENELVTEVIQVIDADIKKDGTLCSEPKLLYIDSLNGYIEVGTRLMIYDGKIYKVK